MKNPIGNVGMFHTPEDMRALEGWITAHGGPEGIHVLTGAMMAWNLAGKYVDNTIARDRAAKKELEYHGARAYRDRRNAA